MRILFILFFTASSIAGLQAQDIQKQSKFGFFAFQTRYLMPNFEKFNQEVTAAGFDGLDVGLIEYSIAGSEQTRKRVSTFAISWVRPNGQGNTPHAQYRHLSAEAETTYSFLKKERTAFGFLFGMGGRWSNLLFVSEEEATSFTQAQAIDFRKYKNFGIPLWAGLDLNMILGKKDAGFVLGLGAGYRFDRVRRWKIEDAATWKTKNIDLSGFYGTIRIGIGGRSGFNKEIKRNTSL